MASQIQHMLLHSPIIAAPIINADLSALLILLPTPEGKLIPTGGVHVYNRISTGILWGQEVLKHHRPVKLCVVPQKADYGNKKITYLLKLQSMPGTKLHFQAGQRKYFYSRL